METSIQLCGQHEPVPIVSSRLTKSGELWVKIQEPPLLGYPQLACIMPYVSILATKEQWQEIINHIQTQLEQNHEYR